MLPTIDLAVFDQTRHNPPFLGLQRALPGRQLRDYCVPVNPYFPTTAMFRVCRDRLEEVLKYYPATNAEVGRVLAEALGLDPETVVLANGSTELLTWIDVLLVHSSLATPVPTFGRWTDHPPELGKELHAYPLRADDDFHLDVADFVRFVRARRVRAVALCNPNNPTGALQSRDEVLSVLDALADLDVVVIDESFLDFADEQGVPTVSAEAARRDNVIVLKSLGKNFGLHGVRAGYAVANRRLAGTLRRALPHWNVNGLAELLIREFPRHRAEYEVSRRRVIQDRVHLEGRLRSVAGLTVYPSRANFVYVRVPAEVDGTELRNGLLTEHGMLVRECGNKMGSDRNHFRIAARPQDQADQLIDALGAVLGLSRPRPAV
jgi:histidinol-phosphate/aromatic aminotransferase/cobyric acid decarboxylase-like protein